MDRQPGPADGGITVGIGQAEGAPDYCTAFYLRGYALVELHRYDEAEKRYRDALAIHPNDAVAQHELGYIAQQRAHAPAPSPAAAS
ncbi:tetratricopeptide repeat protein [uncultured Sphingomonas sp.]|uniref:tetratricopeptide repeat protein n=1 Tax=uncultured Sphingomonas sp. TaxID=158754 RepID=UPI0025E0F619|nr:tetratricopeptide repeat protein [uncultured Sphingomonas sp.]